jgi:hypothetical protein
MALKAVPGVRPEYTGSPAEKIARPTPMPLKPAKPAKPATSKGK